MQTQEDFRFIIPYIEFQKDLKGNKPYLLDTSVVIDGRIADLMETGIVENQLIMPRMAWATMRGSPSGRTPAADASEAASMK